MGFDGPGGTGTHLRDTPTYLFQSERRRTITETQPSMVDSQGETVRPGYLEVPAGPTSNETLDIFIKRMSAAVLQLPTQVFVAFFNPAPA